MVPPWCRFIRYLDSLHGLTAFRTEWTIYADAEILAGSIDFVARIALVWICGVWLTWSACAFGSLPIL